MARQISFLGLGDVYLKDATGGLQPIGSCSQVQFGVEEEEKSQPNYGRAGGVLASATRISAVNIAITMQNLSPKNLARALRGTVSDIEAGTVTAESVTAYPGALVRLAHIDASDVEVTDGDSGSTTYVEGTDYKITSAGLVMLADSNMFSGGDGSGVPLTVNYSYGARSVVQALTESAAEYELVFDGLNEADSGKSCVIDAWRVKFGLPSALDVVGDDYISLELSGTLLADNSKGTGESSFFRWNYAA